MLLNTIVNACNSRDAIAREAYFDEVLTSHMRANAKHEPNAVLILVHRV